MSLKKRSLLAVFTALVLATTTLYLSGRIFPQFFAGTIIGRFISGTPSSLDTKAPPLQSVFTSKGTSARLIKVSLEYDNVETDDKIAEVTAHISMPFDFVRNMNFRWKLGEGVQIVEGAPEGILQGLRAGEEVPVRIKVKGFSLQQNHHVGFEINGALNGKYIHGDALVASDLENTFENTVQNVERIKASQ
jgi:hypothetical protein